MSFTYFSGIPVPTNSPSQDVSNMQQNTTTIGNWVVTDHVGFNNVQGGQHKQITFSANETAPGLPNGSVSALFPNLQGGQSWPFWQNGLGTIQLISGMPSAVTNGTTYLPGGIILQWGTVTPTSSYPVSVSLSGFTNLFNVQFSPNRINTSAPGTIPFLWIPQSSFSNTGFQVFSTSGSATIGFYWLAIGN